MLATSSIIQGFHLVSPPASWGTRNWPLEGQYTPTPDPLLKCVPLWRLYHFWSPLLGLLFCSLLFCGASPST